jgi:hypothetical protein
MTMTKRIGFRAEVFGGLKDSGAEAKWATAFGSKIAENARYAEYIVTMTGMRINRWMFDGVPESVAVRVNLYNVDRDETITGKITCKIKNKRWFCGFMMD